MLLLQHKMISHSHNFIPSSTDFQYDKMQITVKYIKIGLISCKIKLVHLTKPFNFV